MNPEITVTRPAGISIHFLLAGNPMPRFASIRKPFPDTDSADPVEDAASKAAEPEREDSLAFLHKLIMG
jgi:hypothetical protein